ncbi:MAG: signal transduction histidine kinase/CheY-like chemotaxis protein [Planctomycetota bacterium]|jgi:signal transduction histidine kinase/CheY-like chemotaxis protein/ligand-binding sensor domain-containing protein
MSPFSFTHFRNLLVLSAALLLLANTALGQSFRTKSYNELDGLPSSLVYDVDIGPDDRAWFVTRSGIAGFDGVHWEVHRQQTDFSFAASPRLLAFDEQGSPWFTSTDLLHGLGVLRDGEWQQVKPEGAKQFLGQIKELEFGQGPNGEQLFALLTSGDLLRLVDNTWQRIAEQVRDFQCLPKNLLIATEQGVFELSPAGELTALPHVPRVPAIAIHREILSVGAEQTWVLSADSLGLGTQDGFQLLHEEVGRFDNLESLRVSLQPDGYGALFLGCWRFTAVWDHGRLRPLDKPLDTFKGGVTSMTSDDHGNLWMASMRGVYRIPPRAWEYFSMTNGLPENEVSAIAVDENGSVVLGHNSSLSRSSTSDYQTWGSVPLGDPLGEVGRVLDLEPDGNGGMWVAGLTSGPGYLTDAGDLTWLGESAFRNHELSSDRDLSTTSFAIDADGVTWMSSVEQVYRDQGQGFEPVPHSPLGVRRLVASPTGQIFACTSGSGLLRWEQDTWLPIGPAEPGSASESNIYNVYFPRRGPALVGTFGGLKSMVGDTLYPAPWYVEIDAPIYSIFEDSRGWLWLGTERGIFRWNGSQLRHFTVMDGLPGNEVNRDAVFEDDLGRVWFGTDGGLARFSPFREVDHSPPIIRSALVTSKGSALTPGQSISAGDNLAFDVNIASFAGAGTPEFHVRVLGKGQPWSESQPANSSVVHFPNAPPGPFQLEVQARNKGGDWGESHALDVIQVIPQFWTTRWFSLVIIMAGGILLLSIGGMSLRSRQATVLRDELARQTKSLRETELHFERFFSLNPAGQLLIDPVTGLIQQTNAAAEQLFVLPGVPLMGVSISKRLGDLGFATTGGEVQAAISSIQGETRIELATMPAFTPPRHLQLLVARIDRAEGGLVLLTTTDVTVEMNLKQQLHQSQSLRAIGQLAGGLAHDFNNLLTTILGHAELLRLAPNDNEHTILRAQGIQDAGERGAELVRKLLAFGRRQVLQPEVINLGIVVAGVIDSIGDLLGGSISIKSELDEEVGHVRADRVEIDRAVLNLCFNAREAMPSGGVVKVSVREATPTDLMPLNLGAMDKRRWVLLAVMDDGMGMTEEVQARLFEPFFTTKEDSGGAGMGLSTVHGIVSQSGGHLEVHSRLGIGTSMQIFLPIVPAESSASANATAPSGPTKKSLCILLVEDQSDVRRTIAALLIGLGYRVKNAENGVAALELWRNRSEPIDLVMTDIMMPEMGGIELGQELGELAPELPVLYMSGYIDQTEKRVQGTFLRKPFSAIELRKAVASATADRSSEDQSTL